jgi:hypothetical protein
MRAVNVANIKTVHGIRHKHIDQRFVQWPIGLEDAEVGKGRLGVALDGLEPLVFAASRGSADNAHVQLPLQLGLGLLCARQSGPVAVLCELQLVAHGALPYSAAAARRDAAPPQLARARLANDSVPVRHHILVPDAR